MPLSGVSLPIRLGNTGYFELSKTEAKQIRTNLTNLILTMKGERVHQPDFGCDIHKYVFEPLKDGTLAEKCRTAVVSAVAQWLPYIEITNFNLQNTQQNIDGNKLRFYVEYRVRNIPNLRDAISVEI